MTNQELARARAELAAHGADWALLTAPENVTYVSHYEVPLDFGPLAHLNYGPVIALFGVPETTSLLVANRHYAAAARQQSDFDEVIGFGILEVFAPFEKQHRRENFVQALRQALRQTQVGNGKVRIAVEERTLPLLVRQIVLEEMPRAEFVEAEPALVAARKIKTPREIGLLKAVAETVNIAHKTLMRLTQQAGQSEFAIWAEMTKAMHEQVGGKLMIAGEVVCGPRNKSVSPGGPMDYITQPGDIAELDISPRVNGYWADMANTMVIGAAPTPVQKQYARAARESFYAGVSKARPGNKACDIFAAASAAYDRYGLQLGHYAGHGIGTTVNEAPWFVPTDETVLEAGMVVCIETGCYSEEATGKCEKMMVIQPSGDPDIFPDFAWGTPI
ncbi:MAG: aminopeptidase P family protein [Caldilineaceae bacterium]|nr:aminopeptidase P family protein [Caldilineaceae bacterium]